MAIKTVLKWLSFLILSVSLANGQIKFLLVTESAQQTDQLNLNTEFKNGFKEVIAYHYQNGALL